MSEARVASFREGWSTLVGLILFMTLTVSIVDRVAPQWPAQPAAEPAAVTWDHYVARFSDSDKWLFPTPASWQALPSADPGATRLGY